MKLPTNVGKTKYKQCGKLFNTSENQYLYIFYIFSYIYIYTGVLAITICWSLAIKCQLHRQICKCNKHNYANTLKSISWMSGQLCKVSWPRRARHCAQAHTPKQLNQTCRRTRLPVLANSLSHCQIIDGRYSLIPGVWWQGAAPNILHLCLLQKAYVRALIFCSPTRGLGRAIHCWWRENCLLSEGITWAIEMPNAAWSDNAHSDPQFTICYCRDRSKCNLYRLIKVIAQQFQQQT